MKRKKIIAAIGLAVLLSSYGGLMFLSRVIQTKSTGKIIIAWMMDAEYIGNEGVVTQTKFNNCGPSALKMILDYYHIPSSLEEIEQGVKLSHKGSSMLALKEMAELKGLKAEGWNLTLEDFLKSSFPAVLFVNGNHFIVADSVLSDTLYLRDPSLGKIGLRVSNLPHIWKGETLVFKYP
jgi:ABC-type bacteriocin/lantibiotic exporter with double-glycine peptidase domain